MRTLWIFENKPPGTTMKLTVSTTDDNVVTYGAVLQQVTAAGKVMVKKWTRPQLEEGVSADLGNAEGFNIVILPLIRPNTEPVLETDISFSDGESRAEAETLFSNEPVGWRIFMA